MPTNVSDVKTKKTRRALVLGVNGQDGSYLAERLLNHGWIVFGVGRQAGSRWIPTVSNFSYHALDLRDIPVFSALLDEIRPNAVFHFAAVHGSAGFSYEDHWQEVHFVNTISVHAVLEYLRCTAPESILIYASSSKVFGKTLPIRITESCQRYSSCIYTTTKNSATDLIFYYRERHKIKAHVVWTFNHESPRRSSTYFVPRIVDTLAKSVLNPSYTNKIETLSFWSDWGDAEEFMDVIVCIAEKTPGSDLLLATGKTVWAEDFVRVLFDKYGCFWKNHLVEILTPLAERPKKWQADLSTLYAATNRSPVRTIFDVADDILRLNYSKAWEFARNSESRIV